MRAIVAAEEDDRVLVELKLLEPAQDFADVGIKSGDHGRLVFFLLRPLFSRVRDVSGHFHAFVFQFIVGVGNGIGEVEEERMFLADPDEISC